MLKYEEIFENNKKWLAEKQRTNQDFFDKLGSGQNPDFLYIGCSDSRVTAEEVMGADPGEVFVHRNIANMVVSIDLNAMSVINYAVKYLKVKHVIVCGHYGCGGVKAAMTPQDLGILNPWLRNIRDVYRMHFDELNAIKDEHAKYNRLIELNVLEQCINVMKTAVVQEHYETTGFPIVHGWVFDINSGQLIDLNFNFHDTLKKIEQVYDLGIWKK